MDSSIGKFLLVRLANTYSSFYVATEIDQDFITRLVQIVRDIESFRQENHPLLDDLVYTAPGIWQEVAHDKAYELMNEVSPGYDAALVSRRLPIVEYSANIYLCISASLPRRSTRDWDADIHWRYEDNLYIVPRQPSFHTIYRWVVPWE